MGLESKAEQQADGHPARSKAGTGAACPQWQQWGGRGGMDGSRKLLREC